MLKIENVTKTVKSGQTTQNILSNVSLEIQQGDFVSILGPSGAGKSTLLYCLSGLSNITEGKILIAEKPIHTLKEEALAKFRFENLGIIFQDFHLIPMLNVKENIIFVAQMYKKYQDDTYLKELLDIVGLTDKADTPVANLSGGQRQRVAIARALFMKPNILFADEPTGNLDSHTAEVITSLLEKVNREFGTTVVQVTHAEELAKRSGCIIRMKDGGIV
ncbi:ABC transporter ATP-binding protein [Viridibacillus sp. NPDC096237]|uniref:ABC transporter ATP-binding protein n=1 Tax=Viridibacillus sp. NPDC096237 TaxID=3390721 RepID=UPI003D09107E